MAYLLAGVVATDADTAAVDRLLARARRQRQPERDDRSHAPGGEHRPQPVLSDAAGADRADGDAQASGNGRGGLGDCWDPALRLPPAQISVLIELDALRGHTDKTGLTDAGTEPPPDIVRQLACDAEIIPMILNGSGGPADIGRASRTVSRRLRRLLVARDRHCRWPGCSAPPSRCDAHHIIHWLQGGPTNLDNLVLLCHTHHQHLHKHGYRLILEADGSVTVAEQPKSAPQAGDAQPQGP